MKYEDIIPIVAVSAIAVSALVALYKKDTLPVRTSDEYLRYMEDGLNRRFSESRRNTIGGRRTKRRKK